MRHAFLYAFYPSLLDCHLKLPNFTHPLFEVGEHNAKKKNISFSKPRYGPFGFIPRNFRSLLKNKGDVNMS